MEDQIRVGYHNRDDIQRRHGGTNPALGKQNRNKNNNKNNNSTHHDRLYRTPPLTTEHSLQSNRHNPNAIPDYTTNITNDPPMTRINNAFGHSPHLKASNSIRIAGWNVNSFPLSNRSIKFQDMIQHLLIQQYDIIAINETNKNWKLVDHEQRPWRTLTGVWQSVHINMQNNTMDLTADKFQPGGTGIISTNESAHRIMCKGADSTGLGRWSWNKYRGKYRMTLIIVSVYRPVINASGESPNSTWNQQKRYYVSIDQDINPRQQLLHDLGIQMREWYRDGAQITVLMDANEDIQSRHLTAFFQQFQMREAILNKHPHQRGPATRCPGSTTIDGVWASSTLEITQAGFSDFCDAYFDHRSSWIDITCESAFGHASLPLCPFVMRKLKLDDPKVVNKYNHTLGTQLEKHKVAARLHHLKQHIIEGAELTMEQQKEFELIDQSRIEAMIYAESQCRKLKTGEIPWCPELQIYRDEQPLGRSI